MRVAGAQEGSGLSSLDTLGLGERDLTLLTGNLAAPQGLVLVTGPTGSGKTTTVHACLHHLNNVEVNIVTLEDPVEFAIPGVSHVTVNTRGGTTFAGGLRSILRQDPDIVFVGEMRDPEVAQIALRASLTGHLVLSTLHTNSAVESLTRLEDMGLAPYVVAGSLLSIVAQRLVRRVCERCAEPVEPNPDELSALSIDPDRFKEDGVELRKGTGCCRCSGSGYFGRIGVYETLKIDSTTRLQIRNSAPAQQIFQHAREHGMRTMFENGIEAALRARRRCPRSSASCTPSTKGTGPHARWTLGKRRKRCKRGRHEPSVDRLADGAASETDAPARIISERAANTAARDRATGQVGPRRRVLAVVERLPPTAAGFS